MPDPGELFETKEDIILIHINMMEKNANFLLTNCLRDLHMILNISRL